MTWSVSHRVVGELSVARSIGDPDYKTLQTGVRLADSLYLWPEGHPQVLHADLVIPDPEISTWDITADDAFFIIASDGLWDVVSSTDAVRRTQELLQTGRTPQDAALELCELALRLGSSDNVTVLIVQFDHHQLQLQHHH